MATDESRAEFQEIPFRSGGFKHLVRVDPDPLENDAELVDEGNVDVDIENDEV